MADKKKRKRHPGVRVCNGCGRIMAVGFGSNFCTNCAPDHDVEPDGDADDSVGGVAGGGVATT